MSEIHPAKQTSVAIQAIDASQTQLTHEHSVSLHRLRVAGINCLNSNDILSCWVDLRHLLESRNEEGYIRLWKIIIKEIGLNVSPDSSCHSSETGWFRLCFAHISDQTVQDSLNRIQRFMRRRSNQRYDEGGASQKKRLHADDDNEKFYWESIQVEVCG